MKVALFTDGIFPYVMGGMQKHSFYLARYLARAGVEVDLYHFNASDKDISKLELFSEQEKQKIRSFVIPFPSLDKFPGHYLRESFEYSSGIYNAFLKNGKVDYIYAKGFSAWKLLDEKRKGKIFPPVGVNFHGYEMFQISTGWRSKLEQILLRPPVKFNLEQVDHVYSYGGKITELIQNIGVAKSKIRELPTGIEPEWLASSIQPASGIRKFVFVGRYERRKGIEELNRVLSRLKNHRFEFTFVGPIPPSKQMNRPGIRYLGPVMDAPEMRRILQGCDVLVCPSHSEGMPNVIMEAMASGLAVIATDVGAVADMVSDDNGWLIAVQSEKALEQAIVSAIEMPAGKLEKMKASSLQQVADRFLWTGLMQRLISYISK